MTAVEFYHEEMLEMERKWQMQDMNFGQWKEMAVEALRKAKAMEKEQKQSEYTRGFDDGYQRKQEQFDYMRGKNHSCQDNFKNSFKHELNK